MAGMTDYLENKLVDHIFRATSFTMPSTLYVSLHTADPGETGATAEVSGNGYVRAQLNPSTTNWRNTQNSGTGASTGTAGATKNAVAVTWPTPTGAGWGTVTHFAIWDASTGGNCLVKGQLASGKTIDADDIVTAAIDALTVTFA
jgi:hypothetical protein